MGNIVGKLFIIIVSFFAQDLCAALELRVQSIDNEPLKQVCIGEPFIIEVCNTDGTATQPPVIKGLNKFYVRNKSVQMYTVNNKSTVKHTYIVRADKPGMYVVGPALVSNGSSHIQSKPVVIRVGNQQITEDGKEKRKNPNAALLRLSINNDRVVVGQKVNCTLSLYYNDDVAHVEQVEEPRFVNATVSGTKTHKKGERTIDGEPYHFLEWCWQIYPTKSGRLVIPASKVDFAVKPTERINNSFARISSFFTHHYDHKRIYSNACTLDVSELPPHKDVVHAVGLFTAFNAQIEPAAAKQGEALVLTLVVEGDGNLEALDLPVLCGMPSTCNYYDSKNYIDNDREKKYFEYIVQGLEPGDWEIPKQVFTYFDVKQSLYKTLETAPLLFSIVPSFFSRNAQIPEDSAIGNSVLVAEGDQLAPLDRSGTWCKRVSRALPFSWFLILCFTPALLFFFLWLRTVIVHYYKKRDPYFKKRKAFVIARACLNNAEKKQDYALLYHLFIELCAHRMQIPTTAVSFSYCEQLLRDAGLPSDYCEQWNIFFNEIASYAFGKQTKQKPVLFKQAREWIDRLEKIV